MRTHVRVRTHTLTQGWLLMEAVDVMTLLMEADQPRGPSPCL